MSNVEQRVSVASLTSRDKYEVGGGRGDATKENSLLERLLRLQRKQSRRRKNSIISQETH